jgi:hypothetical protein
MCGGLIVGYVCGGMCGGIWLNGSLGPTFSKACSLVALCSKDTKVLMDWSDVRIVYLLYKVNILGKNIVYLL